MEVSNLVANVGGQEKAVYILGYSSLYSCGNLVSTANIVMPCLSDVMCAPATGQIEAGVLRLGIKIWNDVWSRQDYYQFYLLHYVF